jgi:hypothetical protein
MARFFFLNCATKSFDIAQHCPSFRWEKTTAYMVYIRMKKKSTKHDSRLSWILNYRGKAYIAEPERQDQWSYNQEAGEHSHKKIQDW